MTGNLFKKFTMPHVFALLTGAVFVCALLTYVVPSGTYDRQTVKIGGTDRTVVVPGTYHQIPKAVSLKSVLIGDPREGFAEPVGLTGFLSAIPRGMMAASDIIFFIFIIGGTFGILQRSGVIAAAIGALLNRFGDRAGPLTIVIMLALSIGGSTLGMGEEFIPLVPVFLLVAARLGYDRIYGMAMVILAANTGFAAATTNPFTVQVAQGIAELPLTSGISFRLVFYVVVVSVSIGYLLRYGAKIKRDPSTSLVAGDGIEIDPNSAHSPTFTSIHLAILFICLGIFGAVLWAVTSLGWWMAEMSGGFFLMGIVAAAVAKLSVNQATESFVKGMEDMVVAALVVGFARGIEVVLHDAQILDTIIHSAASLLEGVPNYLAVQGMLGFQTLLNFLIPSGSGQAAVTMPLMAPLADVIGITRQTAVFAFQCGDGFTNLVTPTSGILMAMLTLAKIPYQKWLKFILPLLLIQLFISGIFLLVAVAINLP